MKQKEISKADSSEEQLEIINACDGGQEEVKCLLVVLLSMSHALV